MTSNPDISHSRPGGGSNEGFGDQVIGFPGFWVAIRRTEPRERMSLLAIAAKNTPKAVIYGQIRAHRSHGASYGLAFEIGS